MTQRVLYILQQIKNNGYIKFKDIGEIIFEFHINDEHLNLHPGIYWEYFIISKNKPDKWYRDTSEYEYSDIRDITIKKNRIDVVNKLIETIALNGRNFFLNKRGDGEIAFIIEKNNRLYMFNEYSKKYMYLHTKYSRQPKGWTHGGTLWGLTLALKRFIMTGENKDNTLNCTFWGYDDKSIKVIQEVGKDLNYLKDDR